LRDPGGLSVGLLGRLLTILLMALSIEFIASTVLYERSSRTLIHDDEAHRLAEHLVIARKLLSEQGWAERPALAARLTTDRYDVHWAGSTGMAPATAVERDEAFRQVIEWEPSLADSDLRVQLVAAGRRANLFGALRLPDQTWMRFRAAEPVDSDPLRQHRILIALLPAAFLVIAGALLFRHTLRPMGMLARAAARIGKSSGVTLPEGGPREVRRVIAAFNEMQTRIAQLISDRTQALAAVGHDLRTPLARLQLRVDAVTDPALRGEIEADIDEMAAMVSSLLSYLGGEDDPETPVWTDIAVMAATIVDQAIDRGDDASYLGTDHLEAQVRPIGLKRAIGNLVENALHYGQRVRVSVIPEGTLLIVQVDDDGPGIPEDRMHDVLQPFARLDPARSRNTSGLGLGLAIVQRAAETEGGTLDLANRPDGGLRAELRIPRRGKAP
jgi:signal transduction histidine kinase